jgi:hypothetical protein
MNPQPYPSSIRFVHVCAVVCALATSLPAAITPMIGPDLPVFFNRSFDPAFGAYDAEIGGADWVTGAANPLGGDGALRFTDQSGFVAPRILGKLDEPITTQFRISMRAYNNVHVAGGSRGARLRFGANDVGLMTSEIRTAATITFKQDNTIQAKGDLPGSAGALVAQPIALQTAYEVDIIVNVHRTSSYTYQYRGTELTLEPASYHVMVDGVLLPGMPAAGLGFALVAGSDYAAYAESFGGLVDQIGFVSASADIGVDWYFADMVLATGADIPLAGDPVTPQWAGYPIVDDRVDTGTVAGVLHVAAAPWIYSYDLARWVYVPEEAVDDAGLWMHIW